jgi:hypothetical protein
MRRWLTLLLLVLLPLQFTWGAAAAYCGHETSQTTRHIGHHVHAHGDGAQQAQAKKPDPAGLDAEKAKTKFALDEDCGVCHLSAVKPVSTAGMALMDPAAQVMDLGPGNRFSTRAPDHPERPNWRIA